MAPPAYTEVRGDPSSRGRVTKDTPFVSDAPRLQLSSIPVWIGYSGLCKAIIGLEYWPTTLHS